MNFAGSWVEGLATSVSELSGALKPSRISHHRSLYVSTPSPNFLLERKLPPLRNITTIPAYEMIRNGHASPVITLLWLLAAIRGCSKEDQIAQVSLHPMVLQNMQLSPNSQ